MDSVEAVFDWKAYLDEAFGYEVTEEWTADDVDRKAKSSLEEAEEEESFSSLSNDDSITDIDDWDDESDEELEIVDLGETNLKDEKKK